MGETQTLLSRIRDWIVRVIAVALPAVFFAGLYALCIRVFYLDPRLHRQLLLSNAPLKSYFRDPALAADNDDKPVEFARGDGAKSRGRAPAQEPSTQSAAATVGEGLPTGEEMTDVAPPGGSIQELLARTRVECKGVERGEASHEKPRATTDAEREILITLFQNSKKQLLGWLYSQRGRLSDKVVAFMANRLGETGMKLPPVDFEPDLVYRGITAFTRDTSGAPTIAIGSGFLGLIKGDLRRAQFEMTRSMAQGWSPSEYDEKSLGSAHPWSDLMACFGVNDPAEGSWAVSSVLATYLSFPSCRLPAFKDEKAVRCVGSVKLPLSMTRQRIPASLWRVER